MSRISPDTHVVRAEWSTPVLELRCDDSTCGGRGEAVASLAPSAVRFTGHDLYRAIDAHVRDVKRRQQRPALVTQDELAERLTRPPAAPRPSERPH